LRGGHAGAPFLGGAVTVRVRRSSPALPSNGQGLLHFDQCDQLLVRHGSGAHGCAAQAAVIASFGQPRPPSSACLVTVRVRLCVPPPHDLEQAV
jgi:hypothetical protein